MMVKEIKIIDLLSSPKFLYHLVPRRLLSILVDDLGNYDCRNKKEWGKESPFIHTSPSKKQLKERVADGNQIYFPKGEDFLLLVINPKKVRDRVTYTDINGFIYHHIWGILPKESFEVVEVERDEEGRFLI